MNLYTTSLTLIHSISLTLDDLFLQTSALHTSATSLLFSNVSSPKFPSVLRLPGDLLSSLVSSGNLMTCFGLNYYVLVDALTTFFLCTFFQILFKILVICFGYGCLCLCKLMVSCKLKKFDICRLNKVKREHIL